MDTLLEHALKRHLDGLAMSLTRYGSEVPF
jgi:hypothetical protein